MTDERRKNMKPLLCRLGAHRKRLRPGYWADRTFLLIGVNLLECRRCDWHMTGIGEPSNPNNERTT